MRLFTESDSKSAKTWPTSWSIVTFSNFKNFRIVIWERGKTGRTDFEILKGPVENGTNVLSTDCLFYGQGAFIFIFVDLPKLNWVTAVSLFSRSVTNHLIGRGVIGICHSAGDHSE